MLSGNSRVEIRQSHCQKIIFRKAPLNSKEELIFYGIKKPSYLKNRHFIFVMKVYDTSHFLQAYSLNKKQAEYNNGHVVYIMSSTVSFSHRFEICRQCSEYTYFCSKVYLGGD